MDRRVTPTKQVTRPLVVKRSHGEIDYKQLTQLPNDDILLTVAQ